MLGKAAPNFSLASTDGTTFTLSALRGETIVLYFYPKDNTPGCTAEGADFGGLHSQFRRAGARVFGISRDSAASHQRFKEKMRFPFELLSDPDEAVCKQFGVMAHIKAGKLKALAVTGKARLASLPEAPTFEQAGLSGVDASGFQGVLAPAGTPPEAVAKLSDALNKALAQPEVRERFAAAGLDVASSSPAEFAAFIRSEIAKWGRVAKEANIKLD